MSRDLEQELAEVEQSFRVCLAETNPSKQFFATLFLAVISLNIRARALAKTRDLVQRRQLLAEFDRAKEAIRKGTDLLWSQSRGQPRKPTEQETTNQGPSAARGSAF